MRFPVLFLLALSGMAQAQFNRIVAFGDSLSDMGNTSASTFGIQPGSGYWQGRFSNGNVWVERLASANGISLSRSGSGGTNWSFGGAETGTGTFGLLFIQLPNIREQVTRYLNTNPAITSQTLFSIWGGGNDYLNGGTNVSTRVANLESSITALHARGARQFLVPNLPRLGTVPRFVGTSNAAVYNNLSDQHNSLLRTRLSALRTTLGGVTIYEMDVASRFEQIRANPSQFGITNVTQTALVNGTVVANPDQYLFFDDIHPTRRGHQLLADLAINSTQLSNSYSGSFGPAQADNGVPASPGVPEPASIAALGLGALTLLRRRRSRSV